MALKAQMEMRAAQMMAARADAQARQSARAACDVPRVQGVAGQTARCAAQETSASGGPLPMPPCAAGAAVPGMCACPLPNFPLPPVPPVYMQTPPTMNSFDSSGMAFNSVPGASQVPMPSCAPAETASAGQASAGQASAEQMKTGLVDKKLRSVEDIRAGKDLSHVPEGFPQGPIPGDKHMLQETVNRFTSAITDLPPYCGGFHVTLARGASHCLTKGDNRSLCCTHRSRVKGGGGCNWSVAYEESDQGWVLIRYSRASVTSDPDAHGLTTTLHPENHHNHEMIQSVAEAMSKKMGRHIPPDAAEFGRVLAVTGFSTSEIDRAMRKFMKEKGEDAKWYVQDVRQLFRAHQTEVQLDATNLLEYLQEQEKTTGLRYKYRVEGDRLNMVFWELEGGLADWARGGETNVLLFDPTWGTNRYGLKLACFTTVAPTGRTVVLSCVLFRNENAPTFEWCFSCFSEVFVTPPNVFFTDDDAAIAIAFGTLSAFENDPWHGTTHNLCVFHISKNFSRHLKPLFSDNAHWHHVNGRFWCIAKESDVQTIDRWDAEWQELVDYVEKHGRSATSCTDTDIPDTRKKDKKSNALEWLQALGQKKEQWAARFVFRECTSGIHSTQRAESTNSALKKCSIKARMLMTDVVSHVDEFNISQRDRHASAAHLQKLRNGRSAAASSAAVRSLEEKLTPYAMSLVLQQEALLLQYKVLNLDTEGGLPDDVPEPPDDSWDAYVYVQHQKSVQPPAGRVCEYDESNEPQNYDCPTDFGLADAPHGSTPLKYRIVTMTRCSCQYPQAFGGLPCRHILSACLHCGADEYPTDDIDPKWLILDAKEEIRLQENLVHAASQRAEPPAKPSAGSSTSTMNRVERYRVLLSDARGVAEKACESAETFHETKEVLSELMSRLNLGLSVGGAWASHHSNNDDSAPDSGAPNTSDDKSGGQSSGTSFHTDQKDWEASIGVVRQAVPALPDDFEPGDLLNETVLVKFLPKRQGGWFAGKVSLYDEDSGAYQITFEADNVTDWYTLPTKMYSSEPSSVKWSWVLLKRKPLSDECDPTEVRPPAGSSVGRPRTQRFTPPPGHPTARGWQNKRSGFSPMKESKKKKK